MISHTGEDGETIFDDLEIPANQWRDAGNNYSIGDRVSLGINTPINEGTIELSIECNNCKNEDPKISKTVDLTKIKVGEISLTLQ